MTKVISRDGRDLFVPQPLPNERIAYLDVDQKEPVQKVDPCPVADLVIADWNGKELARRKDAISPSLGAIVVSRDRRMILWAGISDRSTCSREIQIVELAASKPGAAKAPGEAGME